jgi:hypothetical protein
MGGYLTARAFIIPNISSNVDRPKIKWRSYRWSYTPAAISRMTIKSVASVTYVILISSCARKSAKVLKRSIRTKIVRTLDTI